MTGKAKQPPVLLDMACVLLLLVVASETLFTNAFSFNRFHRRTVENVGSAPDLWFVQRLDHFNGADTRVWNQRYFINDSFSKPDGPVFLMVGGEGTANPAWMITGTWITYAEKFGALCFLLEHRFYGKSKPTVDLSTKHLHFLNSRQALADLAHFQTIMIKEFGMSSRKWVIFGGSYPGSLAAWYRIKYPHLAYAAVASSAPVDALVNFKEYLEVVQSSLSQYDSTCPKLIKLASDSLVQLLKYPENYQQITRDFKLCKPLQINAAVEKSFFLDSIAQYVMDIVQYDQDNREFEGVMGSNITIKVMCDMMANESQGAPYNRYTVILNTILEAMEEKCIDASYKSYIQKMRNTNWGGSVASNGDRQWFYQMCSEFGFFQSTDSPVQPFTGFPLRSLVQQCIDIFGPAFNLSMVTNAVLETNEFYGGYNIQGSRIVFPNGLLDPWHVRGINKNISRDMLAIQMPGAAHCADMYPQRPEEPAILPFVRIYIFDLLTKWLQQ